MIQDLLALLQAFDRVDVPGTQAALEALVAVVLEDGVVQGSLYTGVLCCGRERLVVLGQLASQHQATLILRQFSERGGISQFLTPRLQREVRLTVGNNRFCGIAVLDDEVTGVARKPAILNLAAGTRADLDHSEDILKMVLDRLCAVAASLFRSIDDGQEVPILRIFEHDSELPCQPELISLLICSSDAFEGAVVLGSHTVISHSRFLTATYARPTVPFVVLYEYTVLGQTNRYPRLRFDCSNPQLGSFKVIRAPALGRPANTEANEWLQTLMEQEVVAGGTILCAILCANSPKHLDLSTGITVVGWRGSGQRRAGFHPCSPVGSTHLLGWPPDARRQGGLRTNARAKRPKHPT